MNLQSIKQRYGIIGRSPALDNALSMALRVANTDLTVLISGESGVGKEVFSQIIHSQSSRKHNNFIAINTGAIPEGTINSELFGHEKGAFTGAMTERSGYFETVDGGTIFLDEIGEMPMSTQAFLLRILESGEYMRVGSSKVLKTDVRVVAATNVDLMKQVRKGKFREDLFYRLNTVAIKVPSLKERREDINTLFRKFASDFSEKYRTPLLQLDDRAQLMIENYPWPGNIRELKNLAEHLSILAGERLITGELMLELVPHILQRNLPAITRPGEGENLQEREILYKLLFEMKHDLNDLKGLVFELISNNDLNVPNIKSLRQLQSSNFNSVSDKDIANYSPLNNNEFYDESDLDNSEFNDSNVTGPIIIDQRDNNGFHNAEVVEENLSLVEMEKDFILKALKKHNGKRKEAATELGISERTLYRKIKFYEI